MKVNGKQKKSKRKAKEKQQHSDRKVKTTKRNVQHPQRTNRKKAKHASIRRAPPAPHPTSYRAPLTLQVYICISKEVYEYWCLFVCFVFVFVMFCVVVLGLSTPHHCQSLEVRSFFMFSTPPVAKVSGKTGWRIYIGTPPAWRI